MKNTYTQEQKAQIIEAYHSGIPATTLCLQHGVARSTIYKWLQEDQPHLSESASSASPFFLEKQLKRKENIIAVLHTVSCVVSSPLKERLNELEKLYGQYPVRVLCEALKVDRGTFYNHLLRNKKGHSQNQLRRDRLSVQIKEIFDRYQGVFGAKKIKVFLANKGIIASARLISELMEEMNLQCTRNESKRIYTQRLPRKKKDRVALHFHVSAPNQAWVSDTTMFRFHQKTYYICAIIDLYARKVLSYKISKKHSTQLVASTFRQAYRDRKPEGKLIFHSDRGSQFTSKTFQKLLADLSVEPSFSPTASPYHNAVAESFFSTLKKEELYRVQYHSERELKDSLAAYMTFYNTERPHSTLQHKTPNAYEQSYKRLASYNKERRQHVQKP